PLRNELQAGKTASGVWNTLPGTALVRTIASTPGISWVLIDAEHGQLNDTNIYEHATATASRGISPIVRIPVDDGWWIKSALDSGAHGVVIPLAHNAPTFRAVVRASKYPPIGIRGFGPMKSHHHCLCRLTRHRAD
ncbi:Phosphoenolpyruvate/pyruvate domain-containing protein, partial [Rickenella mellea]